MFFFFVTVAIVGFIELRDRFDHRMKEKVGSSSSTVTAPASEMTTNGAQLAAMLENAKNSSWRDNLRNASDAQQRFMLPGHRDVDDGTNDLPEYVKKIDERSRTILRNDRERRERERKDEIDTSSGTRFWR